MAVCPLGDQETNMIETKEVKSFPMGDEFPSQLLRVPIPMGRESVVNEGVELKLLGLDPTEDLSEDDFQCVRYVQPNKADETYALSSNEIGLLTLVRNGGRVIKATCESSLHTRNGGSMPMPDMRTSMLAMGFDMPYENHRIKANEVWWSVRSFSYATRIPLTDILDPAKWGPFWLFKDEPVDIVRASDWRGIREILASYEPTKKARVELLREGRADKLWVRPEELRPIFWAHKLGFKP